MSRDPEPAVSGDGSHITESATLTANSNVTDAGLPVEIQENEKTGAHKVIIAGCSYGGITALLSLLSLIDGEPVKNTTATAVPTGTRTIRGVEIIVIDERDGFFHTVGAPLAHVERSFSASFWKRFNVLKELQRPEVKFIRGSVQQVDPGSRTVSYTQSGSEEKQNSLSYDYFISATGLRREWPIVPKSLLHREYLSEALGHIDCIERAKEGGVVVIGGGAVGIEFAGEIKNYHPGLLVTLIHSRKELLSNEPLPAEFKAKALQYLQEQGVEVILNQRPSVFPLDNGRSKIVFGDNTEMRPGYVFTAASKVYPSTGYLPAAALDEHGYVKITSNLSLSYNLPSPKAPLHDFAVGDIASWSGIRRAGAAMAMAKIAAINVYSSILSTEDPTRPLVLGEFPEVPPMMGLAVGKKAIGYGGPDSEYGIKFGEDVMADLFGKDLAWTSSLNYLGLTELDEEELKKIGREKREEREEGYCL